MALIPPQPPLDPTLDAAIAAIESANKLELPRAYLGMSAVGMECERYLWLNFRWAGPAGGGFDAKSLCSFEDGHRTEDVMAKRLRAVPGIKLYTVDSATGQQFGFSGLGGHLRGHIDGVVQGLIQVPGAWHVWENKASEKGPADLTKAKAAHGEKQALAAWSPTYYAQAILYMHYASMERHYLTCSSPGGRLPWTSVRTNASPEDAQRFIAKAERVIFGADPAGKLSEDAAHWKCKGCVMSPQCHGQKLPAVSCRTCLHATPKRKGDGRWSCAKWNDDIPLDAQRKGCEHHRYIPALLKSWGEPVDASETEGWVEYKAKDGFTFRNGPQSVGSFTSAELAASTPAFIKDPVAMGIRNSHSGTIVDKEAA